MGSLANAECRAMQNGIETKMKREKISDESARSLTPPYNVRLPGFITEQEIGLGDIIKRVTYRMGITSCAGCDKRAKTLNRWMVFSPRR